MARESVPVEVSRKASQMATKALREKYAKEYANLIDWAYLEQGYKSPADRRREREAAAAEAALLRKQKAAARMAAKIEEAVALLRENGIEIIDGVEVVSK